MPITLVYCPHGDPVSDFTLDRFVKSLCRLIQNGNDEKHFFSSSNVFTRVLQAIAEDDLQCEDIAFEFEGQVYHPNKWGTISPWPSAKGFLDIQGNMSEAILRGMMYKKGYKKFAKENMK